MNDDVKEVLSDIVAHCAMKLYIRKFGSKESTREILKPSMDNPKGAYNKGVDELSEAIRKALKNI